MTADAPSEDGLTGPTYPPARTVAVTVRRHFADWNAVARERGDAHVAPEPDERTIEEIVSAAFWASLRREEGRSPKISLAFLPPDETGETFTLGRRLRLDPGVLTKLAPAVERPGIHLGVWREDGDLFVWGSTRMVPPSCFVLEVVEPGLLVIKRRRGPGAGKYANVAVLHGDRIKLVDEGTGGGVERPPLIESLLGLDSVGFRSEPINVVVQLAVSMRAHGHGGILLIVPNGSSVWRQSIVHPIPYPVAPPYTELRHLLQRGAAGRRRGVWRESVQRATDAIAGLTAVDGATVLSDRYDLFAYGAKISRSAASEPVQQVVLMEPIVGARAVVLDPSDLGGTRHLSAAQFVHDQRDALALVASQDGRFTIFGWPAGADALFAFPVESLLL